MSANELKIETLLRAHAPRAPESLRARVLAGRPAPRTSWSLPPRRLALVVFGAACLVAVGVALVHGVVRSGGNVTMRVSHGAAAGAGDTSAAPSRVGVTHLGQIPLPAQKSAGVGASGPALPTTRLAHTDASLQIRVADKDALASATTRATRIATSLGGYAKSVEYRTPQEGGGAAYIELRVPAQNVKAAMSRLAGLGTIVSQQLSVTDLQDRFRTQSEQIAQLRRRVAALRGALRDASLPDAQKVLLRIKLSETKRALAQRLSAREGTLAAGTTARISLEIGTEKAIVPVAHRGRLGRMLHSAVGFLALEAMIALYALIVISPLALIAGIVWLWRRRSIDRLLAT
jgi:Domain of unknown function (DUF4349)